MSPAYAFGDVHGILEPFARRLQEAGLVDGDLRWSGGEAQLWLTGDLADRGPFGIEAISLVMRLETEARATGGAVCSLLGNHDLLLLAVARFSDLRSRSAHGSILAEWKANGGRERDLAALTDEHLDWLASRPALGRQGTSLLAHCDSLVYLRLGASIDEVNRRVTGILSGEDVDALLELESELWRRNELWDPVEAGRLASAFGCERVVHGHTPIPIATSRDPAEVTEPLVYAHGICVNVDGGLYLGGPGFLFELDGGAR